MSYMLELCPSVGTHRIRRSDESRVVVIDSMIVKFSPTEYRLVKPLLEGRVVSDADLVHEGFSCEMSAPVRENLDKHIDKIRSKLRPSGLNIHRVAKFGYILLATND